MSEPMSNGEIEDVLSSIRRLVSENAARPGAAGDAAEQALVRAERAARAAPGALVLTEALRIEDSGTPEPEPEGAAGGGEARAETGAPARGAPQDAPPDATDAATAPREAALDASWEQLADPARAPEAEEDGDAPAHGAEGTGGPDAAPPAPEEEAALRQRIAGLEAAFDAGADFEPDGSEVAATAPDHPWEGAGEEDGEDTVIDLSTPDVPSGKLLFMRSPGARELGAGARGADESAEAPAAASEADAAAESGTDGESAEAERPAEPTWPYPLPGPRAEAPPEPLEEEPWPYPLPDAAAGAEAAGTGDARPDPGEEADADDATETGVRDPDGPDASAEETAPAEARGAPVDSPREPEAGAAPEAPWSEPEAEEDWPAPAEDWTAPDLPRPEAAESVMFRSSHREATAPRADVEEAELVGAPAGEDGRSWSPEDRLEDFIVGTQQPSDARRLHFAAPPVEAGPLPDAAEPEDGAAAEEEAFDEAALAAALGAPERPALIDEARLVELVSEVVRQELRGALGERITQNVRKLVRREIARALETRGIR